MKKLFLLFLLICISLTTKTQVVTNIPFASDSTLEVMTWNLEGFPKNGQLSIEYVAQFITALDIDVIAIQEIENTNNFETLISLLDSYSGTYESSYFAGLGYIYKNNVIDVNDIYEIYTNSPYWSIFPRAPLVIDFNFQSKHYIVINNHLKCCGDGFLNESDQGDEETRRYLASNLLKEHIDTFLPQKNVFVVGDLNDVLDDSYAHNVFREILDDKAHYLFADLGIAYGTEANWSYPTWPSHLDHIIITDELFNAFDSDYSSIQTLKLDEFVEGGWDEYEENVSDHRPVAIKLLIPINLGNEPPQLLHTKLNVHPNPFSFYTTITLPATDQPVEIEITDIFGRTIFREKTEANQSTFTWQPSENPPGIYLIRLFINGQASLSTKLIYNK